MPEIRISCASLASIIIEDKYLLLRNKRSYKKGEIVYSPIGGALEYSPEGKSFLDNLGAKYERETPDLRLYIDLDNVNLFQYWFEKNIDRESNIDRELKEELVDEENIFNSLETTDYKSTFLHLDIRNVSNTKYFFEIWNVIFSKEKINHIKNSLKDGKIILATESEIKNGITLTGFQITNSSTSILI
jgi:hypothetical protein